MFLKILIDTNIDFIPYLMVYFRKSINFGGKFYTMIFITVRQCVKNLLLNLIWLEELCITNKTHDQRSLVYFIKTYNYTFQK